MNTSAFEVVVLNDHAAVTGGAASVAIASAVALAARGIRVTYFAGVGPVAAELQGVENLEVICLGQEEIARNPNRLQAFASGWMNRVAVRALANLLQGKSTERTVVHAHSWSKALSPFVLSTVSRLGFPLVVTLHDFFIACPSGGFFVHRTGELCTRRPLSLACWRCNCDRRNYGHKLWRGVRTVLQNSVLGVPARVAHYVAVSDFSRRVLQPYLPATARTTVVRHPLASTQAGRANVAENSRFVFVGRFEHEKGVLLFAEAARAANVAAVFVGEGALREAARARCPTARFTGWLDRDGIRREIRQARALVFPPLWYETLGLVVLEAAAEGVPAIVASRCAATDHIRDGVSGLHFAHGDSGALARQMENLARNPALADELGAAAYEWYWHRPWTVENHATELIRIYRDVLGAEAIEKEEVWNERVGGVRARG